MTASFLNAISLVSERRKVLFPNVFLIETEKTKSIENFQVAKPEKMRQNCFLVTRIRTVPGVRRSPPESRKAVDYLPGTPQLIVLVIGCAAIAWAGFYFLSQAKGKRGRKKR
jgi:hypothetical protein